MNIHPTAVIDPEAQLSPSVRVGPYAVIGAKVVLGEGCEVGPHVVLFGPLEAGSENQFHAGCVIGDAPQDKRYQGQPTGVSIGNGNIFREHVTVHRSSSMEEVTVIGDRNFLMAGSHVGHNCRLGNDVVMANGAMLGGHVQVDDRVFISGNCLIHQFVRVGRLALMQGRSGVSKDVPPFTVATEVNQICGLNLVGLRRAGFGMEVRTEIKRVYRELFRAGKNVSQALEALERAELGPEARELVLFVGNSKRGVCVDCGADGAERTVE